MFGLALASFCLILLKYFERAQIEAFDSALFNYTVDLSAALEMDFVGRLFVIDRPTDEVDKAFPFHLGATFFEIRDVRGRSLLNSAPLKDHHLPFDPRQLETLARDRAYFRSIDTPRAMRLITYWAYRAEWREPLVIQIAAPLDLAARERRDLALFFVIGIPLFILAAALLGAALSKRALKPLHDMTQKARGITGVGGLGERVPIPRAKDEIYELAQTFNDLLDRLEGAFASQERFVANASHQLRTPLTILKGELDALRHAPGEGAALAHALGSATDEINRLIRLVHDLLMLARLDGGRDALARARVRPADVLLSIISRVQRAARAKDVTLNLSLTSAEGEDEVGVEIAGDPDLIESMLENFVDNAIKYAAVGTTVDLATRTSATHVDVTVRDRGPGIPAEMRGRVFERFVRGPSTDGTVGSGLGLAIAAEIARLHGATIALDQAAGGGTLVHVRFARADFGH